ncbi:AraC family transcriptional regulator [Lysobacter sp. S4-A87]|uniref:helix-turn-helix transcriptional regulator n=1 Tax=Lysobacter sp. S4-A87 TaxID=2925843 RepID=UPI001F53267C|nr:AraC family transcriptional regulator [Lysobacter sp. S4-A87]UNK49116.1 AraC family transcriptional regulator [Lysobacter sp. S4-A87]
MADGKRKSEAAPGHGAAGGRSRRGAIAGAAEARSDGLKSFTLEQWRQVSRERYNWDLQLHPGAAGAHRFVGEYSAWGDGDTRFLHSRAMAARVRPFNPAQGGFRLVFLLSGQAQISAHAGPEAIEVGQGDLFVLDTGAVKHAQWTAHSDLCLQLPRHEDLRPRVGDDGGSGRAVIPIDDPVVSNVLKAQLRLLAARGGELAGNARTRMLSNMVDLTVMALRAPEVAAGGSGSGQGILLEKAKLYVQTHFRRHDLSVDEIAAAVGCSRTSLYRLFCAQSLTVLGYLRETRLQRCRAALAASPAQANIGQVAFQHGFVDLHAFTRLFKRRFGMTPGQARASERY